MRYLTYKVKYTAVPVQCSSYSCLGNIKNFSNSSCTGIWIALYRQKNVILLIDTLTNRTISSNANAGKCTGALQCLVNTLRIGIQCYLKASPVFSHVMNWTTVIETAPASHTCIFCTWECKWHCKRNTKTETRMSARLYVLKSASLLQITLLSLRIYHRK